MKELLLKALERMDRSRGAIQRETGLGYGILDTSDLRQELQQLEIYEQAISEPSLGMHEQAWVDELIQQSVDTLTKSQITSACIKAGIIELYYIQFIHNNSKTPEQLEADIEYILSQKQKYNEKSNQSSSTSSNR